MLIPHGMGKIKTAAGMVVANVDHLTSAAFMKEHFPLDYYTTCRQRDSLVAESFARRKITNRGYTTSFTDDWSMQLASLYPRPVLHILQEFASEILEDDKEFYKWLQKHPEWKIGETVVTTVGA